MTAITGISIAVAVAIVVALFVTWRLRRAREPLTVGPIGIRHRGLGRGWIRWEEIEGAYPPSAGNKQLRLRVRLSARLARRLKRRRHLAPESRVGDSIEIELALDRSRHSALDLMQRILSQPPPPVS